MNDALPENPLNVAGHRKSDDGEFRGPGHRAGSRYGHCYAVPSGTGDLTCLFLSTTGNDYCV